MTELKTPDFRVLRHRNKNNFSNMMALIRATPQIFWPSAEMSH